MTTMMIVMMKVKLEDGRMWKMIILMIILLTMMMMVMMEVKLEDGRMFAVGRPLLQ